MGLTKRKEQFLAKLKELYDKLKFPVSYQILAEEMKVSRWTAYDMLRALEKEGLVIREYLLEKGKSAPGRSAVGFIPKIKQKMVPKDIEEELLRKIREVKTKSLSGVLKKMKEELASENTPFVYCSTFLAYLTVVLHKINIKGLARFPQIWPQKSIEFQLRQLPGFILGLLHLNEFGQKELGKLKKSLGKFTVCTEDLALEEAKALLSLLESFHREVRT
ncbi:hypothetical protein [Carboxydothermus pertinax]|uniref:Uncharacterized protein n=1 Tax=Carboxydothermus pertinax TaxID=870242 RepID=A0A1L8CS24_9THEO|nr:hypothetical protein [Carboxydothermus pertinax]GAV21726.1 hypothetical protein cpu_02360 [Carboxydothermus pertinax]